MGILLQWHNIEKSISLVTFNTLAEAFIKEDFFKDLDKESLSRANRATLALSWLQKHQPHIVCLQEVDAIDDQLSYIKRITNIGYRTLFLKKRGTSQGQLLAWRKQTVKLLNSKYIFYSEQFIKPLKKSIQYNVAIMALFKHRQSQKLFTVACTHLYWNPKKQQIKYQQLAILLKNYSRYYPQVKSRIICGDLNSTPESCVIDLLRAKPPKDSQDTHRTIFQIWQSLQKTIAYQDAYREYEQPTNITKKFTGKIDHLWTLGIKVLSRLELDPLWKKQNLPNELFPSDHLPLGIRFDFAD